MELSSQVMILVTDWFRRVRESQRVHYECGNHFSRLNYLLGIPTIALSVIVGTTVFASLDKQATGQLKIALGLVSITAAVLASLQTFLSFAERANRHRTAGAEYGAIRRTLEQLKTMPPQDEHELRRELDSIKKTMDELAKSAPNVPSALKTRIDNELKSREHRRIFQLSPDPPNEAKNPKD
jgi:hypothetical protein